MSLRKYLVPKRVHGSSNLCANDVRSWLPNPSNEKTPEKVETVQRANSAVKEIESQGSGKRKRGSYSHYTDENRAKIGKWACENGNTSAAKHFSKILQVEINESTVRSIKKQYLRQLKQTPENEISSLSKGNQGRPKLLGKYDDDVVDYNKKLLNENGGHIEFSRTWAESFLKRVGYVRRKGTKAARKLPFDFEEQRESFITSVTEIIEENKIPSELVINFDQTNISIIPCGNWTMHEEGSKQVEITGLEDKRQITALLSCTKNGDLLPPQLLYQGKTSQCHPNVTFPKGWDVFHTENQWSNEDTMCRFAENILLPYIESVREDLDLPLRQRALCIFDVFAAHRTEKFLNVLKKASIIVKFIPGGCPGELQPLDLSGNAQINEEVKSQFTRWYAKHISSHLKGGKDVKSVEVDLKLSVIKPHHAKWVISAWEKVKSQPDIIRNGWYRAGI